MRHASIAILTGAAALAGCASTPSVPATARIVVRPGTQLSISSVRAEDRTTSLLVRGRVGRRALTVGPVWGHLHLELWGERGMLACKDTLWSPEPRRGRPAAFFNTTIQQRPSQVEEIRISHASASHRPCPSGPRP